MKYKEALKIIEQAKKPKGYMVSFEVKDRSILRSDHFPDKHAGEKLIPTEEEAWDLARQFANATNSNFVNIYVVDQDFGPVSGYSERTLKKY